MKFSQLLKNAARLTVIAIFFLLYVNGLPVFAAGEESGGDWRPTYDTVMMFVNFIILVFILVKLLKNPIKNFFNSQRQEISDEISQLKREKERTEAELHDVEKRVVAGDAHIQTIKEKLAEDGESIKDKIIETARQQSEFMLAAARKNVDNQFLEARKAFQAELIDMAMSAASEKLISEIEDKDHEKLVNQFLYNLAATGQ